MSRRGAPHETFKVGKYTVNICHDEYADSPAEWGDEERYIAAWHREFSVGPHKMDSLSSFSEFVHPQYREEIIGLIEEEVLSGSEEPAAKPFDGPTDPIWREDYIEGCANAMEQFLLAAEQESEWKDQDGRQLAHDRYVVRRLLWDAWAEYKKAHSEWAVFELDVQYYGGGCLRIHLGDLYDGDPTDYRGRHHEPDGFVVIKREEGVDTKLAAEALVSMWDQYLEGDVWFYEILDENEDTVESCGGYYGLDDCIAEARSLAEHFIKKDNDNTNKEAC